MQRSFVTRRKVEFSHTDMAGISHFTNYFRYMEEAEHEFLRSVGLNVVMQDAKGTYGFPKLSAECRYRRPAVYGAELTIHMHVHADDGKTISYRCQMLEQDELVAEGQIRVACCRFPANQLPFAIPLTDEVLARLGDGKDPVSA
ncbi:MAG: thioesterase family protein [Pirellulaceae bacterium]